MAELKLHATSSERDYYENLADVYSIINCLEHLEKAYIRDIIQPSEYTPACLKLIAQYKTSLNLIAGGNSSGFTLDSFMKEYSMSCPAARSRLEIGVPATVEHTTGESAGDGSKNVKYVSEIVQSFITLMDSLKLNMVAVDQLHPLLSDLMTSLNKLTLPPNTTINKNKIRDWLVTLNKMRASEELNEDQARQLLFDLDSAFGEFNNALK